MSTEEKSLHFIEQIIEDSVSNGFPKINYVSVFRQNLMDIYIGHAKSICLNFGLGLSKCTS
jgi:glutaminyl-tRNA synthetase